MLIGKQFSIWEKKNATSSSICQIQYFAGNIHINTPTIYLPISRTTERITLKTHREGEGISLIDRTVMNTPWHIPPPIEQLLASQVLKHPPSTTNRPYLKHSIVCIQLCFPERHEKTAFFFSASILNPSQIEFSMHAINEVHLRSFFLPRESQRGRTILADHDTIMQLCSPCKCHRDFIP